MSVGVCSWKKTGGAWSLPVSLSKSSTVAVSDGLLVQWVNDVGHTVGVQWTVAANATTDAFGAAVYGGSTKELAFCSGLGKCDTTAGTCACGTTYGAMCWCLVL